MVLADIMHHDEYIAEFQTCGLQDVRMVENGFPAKLVGTFLVWRNSPCYRRRTQGVMRW